MSDAFASTGLSTIVDGEGRCTVREALDGLVHRYHDELMRILTARTGNAQDAADLEQETYARLLGYAGHYSLDELRRLLFRIAGNLLTDHWRSNRHRSRDAALSADHLTVPDEAPAHENTVLTQQQLALLEDVILAMPPRRRKAFVLSRLHGLTHAEVARRCGISAKTVEKHLALALAECREKLCEVGRSDRQPLYRVP